MAYEEITALLGGWPGLSWWAWCARRGASEDVPRIVLTLRGVPGQAKICSRCGAAVTAVHEVTPREVRDLPILDAETWLIVPRARVECPRCGPTVEAVAWLDRYQRMTTRLAEAIARLAQVLPIKHVARWYGLGWDTVKQIDRRALAARLLCLVLGCTVPPPVPAPAPVQLSTTLPPSDVIRSETPWPGSASSPPS